MLNLAAALESLTPADWVDLLCAAVVLLGVIQGAFRGFSGELSRLVSAVVALAAALWLRRPLGLYLAEHTRLGDAPGQAPLVVFVVVFMLALVIAFLVRRGLGRFVRLVVTPTTDFLLGILSGGTRMVVVLLAILIIWTWLPESDSRNLVIRHTRAGRLLAPVIDAVNRRIEDTPMIADPLYQWSGTSTPARAEETEPSAEQPNGPDGEDAADRSDPVEPLAPGS